jgi:hypothetical protein
MGPWGGPFIQDGVGEDQQPIRRCPQASVIGILRKRQ